MSRTIDVDRYGRMSRYLRETVMHRDYEMAIDVIDDIVRQANRDKSELNRRIKEAVE